MEEEIKGIDGYILAGGKSSRMGTDKGLLSFHGEPLVSGIIKQISPAVQEVFIVSNNAEYNKFGCDVIPDMIHDIGPAGGIHAALLHTDKPQVFVLSCDMPFVTPEAIKYIIQQSTHPQITLPLHKGKIQPLFGVYSKNCLLKWRQIIEEGIFKLQEMVTHFDLLKINTENNDSFNDSVFTNVNDKDSFEKALKTSGS